MHRFMAKVSVVVFFSVVGCGSLLAQAPATDNSVHPITSLPKPRAEQPKPPATTPTPAAAPADVAPPEAPPAVTATPAAEPIAAPVAAPVAPEPAPSTSAARAPLGPPMLQASTNPGPLLKRKDKPMRAFSAVAIGVTVGAGGIGAHIATPLSQTTNFRVGSAFFSYSGDFTEDGLHITGDLKFRSVTANLDWFPFHGGFRISPGVTLYNGNNLNALVNVPGGQAFSLGDTDYISSATDPVHGTSSLTFGNRTAPNITFGWGNMIPRSGRHISVPVEFGFEYIGQPLLTFNLVGTACNNLGCTNIATDPTAQANLKQEQNDLNSDISPLRFYPIASIGLSYRF